MINSKYNSQDVYNHVVTITSIAKSQYNSSDLDIHQSWNNKLTIEHSNNFNHNIDTKQSYNLQVHLRP